MRKVLVMVPDLMFAVKIGDVVRVLGGVPVEVSAATLLQHVADADLLMLDSGQHTAWPAAVRGLKADALGAAVPVLAFGPHVDVAAQRTALAVGCDRVVTRGKFAAELPALIVATIHSSDPQRPVLPVEDAV